MDNTEISVLAAGLFSGLTSHVISARYAFPRVLAQLRNSEAVASATAGATSAFRRATSTARNNSNTVKDILPSLGASGAIYATVTLSALAFPDAQVFLMFLPIPIPITYGVGGMVMMDVLGIVKGWRLVLTSRSYESLALIILCQAFRPLGTSQRSALWRLILHVRT